jgi:hypothetical protein
MARVGAGIIFAILANATATTAIARETRKIRELLEARLPDPLSNVPVSLNLTGRLVPKQGGSTVPSGDIFTPDETQDVDLVIAPLNAANQPTTGPFVWNSSIGATPLTVSADTLSAKFVTPTGDLDVVVSVSYPANGKTETVAIKRTAPPPPDNNPVALNISGTLVPKVATA